MYKSARLREADFVKQPPKLCTIYAGFEVLTEVVMNNWGTR
jgi:hypothetical protein